MAVEVTSASTASTRQQIDSLSRCSASSGAPTEWDPASLASQLRLSITATMQTYTTISCFLCALSVVVYVETPEKSRCELMDLDSFATAMGVVAWAAIAMFTAAIGLSILVVFDIDGVPDELLLLHLKQSVGLYNLPLISLISGLALNIVAFVIDAGLRLGCNVIGGLSVLAGLCFILVVGMFFYLRRRRQRLNRYSPGSQTRLYGISWLATYIDRVPAKLRGVEQLRMVALTATTNDLHNMERTTAQSTPKNAQIVPQPAHQPVEQMNAAL